jgi:hypothetical protein
MQRVALGHILQRADLVHHLSPYRMPGIIAGQPRPLRPKRGIELGLLAMQADQMMGHMPEISFVHEYTCPASPPAGEPFNARKTGGVPPLDLRAGA